MLALFLGGCLPEERVWWTPDGQQAAVLSEKALYLIKPGSGLGEPLAGGTADKQVIPTALSWLSDASGFVLCRERKIASWDDVEKLVPPAEVSRIELLARAMPALLEGAEKIDAKPAEAESLLTSVVSGADAGDFLNALLHAYLMNKPAIEKLLLKLPKGAEALKSLNGDSSRFTVYDICLLRIKAGREDGPALSLARSLYAMSQPKVSKNARAVAWFQLGSDQKSSSIEISSLDGKERLTAGKTAKAAFDWSADGHSLIFASPVGGNGDSLAKIQRTMVIQESGALVKSAADSGTPNGLPPPVEMGMGILLDPPRLQVLPDGRVLFSSQPATLPVPGSGPEIDPRLYLLSADAGKLEAVTTSPGSLPTNLSFFAASPDGKLAAVVESGNDAVALVDLATGAVQVISPSHPDWQCRTMPAWKSSSELTFAAVGKSGHPEWMLWSKADGVRTLSGKWPAEATGDWLKKEDPKQQPKKE